MVFQQQSTTQIHFNKNGGAKIALTGVLSWTAHISLIIWSYQSHHVSFDFKEEENTSFHRIKSLLRLIVLFEHNKNTAIFLHQLFFQ